MILVLSAFIAGLLMFLAPCTLPLVPAYLAFISGVKESDVQTHPKMQQQIRINALAFVLGFSLIFILFGVLAGFFGTFVGQYKAVISQIGGGFIIVFGLLMLDVLRFTPLRRERKIPLPSFISPGKPSSAFLIGSIFALGWTPCAGPILASILLLAATKATVLSGALLLTVFSLGLAIPFMVTAVLYTRAYSYIQRYTPISALVTNIGGAFLVLIGSLLLFGNFILFVQYGYEILDAVGIGNLLNYY